MRHKKKIKSKCIKKIYLKLKIIYICCIHFLLLILILNLFFIDIKAKPHGRS